jgi:hypothetical protein
MKNIAIQLFCAALCNSTLHLHAQLTSGSDGTDGVFSPTANTRIDMSQRPDGIYQFTSVNIPTGITVTFIPNANNTPVVWLIQNTCVINGSVDVSGQGAIGAIGGAGGPGGGRGGSAGNNPTSGQGPGGGGSGDSGAGGSFGTQGQASLCNDCPLASPVYGNIFLVPLLAGSGGGSGAGAYGSGGGGGAILICAARSIELNGTIHAEGGAGGVQSGRGVMGTGGSGGGIRLVTTVFKGSGNLTLNGGSGRNDGFAPSNGGAGRLRIDALENRFGGNTDGVFSLGFQPIIIPTPGLGTQLSIASVGGGAVSTSPTGVLVNPDVIISGAQLNPVSIEVHCLNLPLNTPITVTIKPSVGPSVNAVGLNTSGTQVSSTATIPINMPRGGGIIYATAGN